MKKFAFLLVLIVALTACSSSKVHSDLQKGKQNKATQADLQRAEQEVSACYAKDYNLLSKPVRKRFVLCIGHGRKPAQTEGCVAHVAGGDIPLHRKRFVQDVAQKCVLA